MINNRNVYRDDKWPVLGDIPLVGRLFTSQLAFTDSVTLLIFLTARLINNDGVPVRRERERGIPDFYR
jgi:general secretion pathway protein D